MARVKAVFSLLKEAFEEWNRDRAPRLAAALAYYTTFSIAPFLIIVLAVAGAIFDREMVRAHLFEQIQALVGPEGATLIGQLIDNIQRPTDNLIAGLVGIATLVLGASGVVGQLQDALNTVWDVQPQANRGIVWTVINRFLSVTIIMGMGFMLLVSLVINTAVAAAQSYLLSLLPGAYTLLQSLSLGVTFIVITVIIALIYKLLPNAKIEWRDVWVGAAFTAFLFTLGNLALGFYLGNSGVASVYGAAGALVLVLLWIFYSAQIVLFGAEFTQVYARRYGSRIRPIPVEETETPTTNEA